MTALLEAVGHLALLLLGGVALVWLLRSLGALARISPLPWRIKTALLRLAPAAELILAVAYVASSLAFLLNNDREFGWMVAALVLALVLFSWSALYDLVCGVAFRVALVCRPGDLVQVEDVEGRVMVVGARALVLQTRQGDEAVVPYGWIARRTLRRTQSVSGAYVHAFELDQEAGAGFADLKRTVIEAAMRSHWSSVVHEPKVERRGGTKIEVTVYAHDADHAPLVEAAVRKVLVGREAAQVFDGAPPPRTPTFRRPLG
ncbi:MAG: mechanosensitive ion channel domain-containing protein [Myxococcota bacterium]